MEYTKQNFEDGQILNAEHLNNIEDGIVKLAQETGGSKIFYGTLQLTDDMVDTQTIETTYEELISLLNKGIYDIMIIFEVTSADGEDVDYYKDDKYIFRITGFNRFNVKITGVIPNVGYTNFVINNNGIYL